MAATSVGQIGLDLVVNKNGFEKHMSGIAGLAKKAGAALAAAFAVKKLVDFGKACIDLGSDLQEVQNVVDVTFPAMTAQVDAFAKSAISSFGLSETMTKQFTGTFGAMAKAFGFSESAAYDMSTALTGLAGDVASFYNISQEEAYTKLKSVFTGETESLKDLGVVMTQTALDAYALANGYGKTTAKMTEAEKVALRYKFVQQQLTAASGDFLRTSDGWANQVRVLKLQFDSLKATIGQGLINVLTPVIKVINTLVGKLMTLANAFKAFTEMLNGGKKNGAAADMKETAAAAGKAADATEAIGTAAAKSAKAVNGALAGFDELNVLQKTAASGAGGSAGGSAAGGSFDFGSADTSGIDAAEEKCRALNSQVKELVQAFREGFREGIGDTSVFDSIKTSVRGIRDSVRGIFTDGSVINAAEECSQKIAESLGKTAGSAVSIGASICDNLLGGLSGYLQNNSSRIAEYIVEMFDISGRTADISGNFSSALGTIAESLRSEGAKRITESVIGIFSDAFMGATQLLGNLAADLIEAITAPFINNSDGIRAALEDTFTAVAPVVEDIRDLVGECFGVLQETYDNHVAPMLQAFRDGFTELGEKALELYSTYMVPVLEGISEKFGVFKDQYLSPLIQKFGEFAGKVADAVKVIWNKALKPLCDNFMKVWYPVIAQAISAVADFFMDMGAVISETAGGVLDALGGLLDFIIGVFTGDWDQAWDGISKFFSGIWNAMCVCVDTVIHAIYNLIKNVLNTIKTFFQGVWDSIKNKLSGTLNAMRSSVSSVFSAIFTNINSVLTRLRTVWSNIWNGMKNTVVNIFNGMWSAIRNVINSILRGVEAMANGIVNGLNRAIKSLNRISFSVPGWVPGLGGLSFGFSVPYIPNISLPRLAQGGYVKPNTPQLAMIGDNRHQGEVVAPEDKLQEMAVSAARAVMQSSEGAAVAKLEKIISIMMDLLELVASGRTMEVDGKVLAKTVRRADQEYYRATGKHLFTT